MIPPAVSDPPRQRAYSHPKTVGPLPQADRAPRESWWQDAPRTNFTALAIAHMPLVSKADKARQFPGRPKGQPKPVEAIPPRPEIECVVCGARVVMKPRGPHRIYCSHACCQKAWKARRKAS
jgi:DNA-directed RNA polymerase subunit RPC12/RpoP